MPAWPGAHLILVHAHFTLAPLKARLDAGARFDHPRQFPQRGLLARHPAASCRREVIMVAVAGVLISGIRRSLGLQCTRRRQGTTGDDEPLLGSRPFPLDPRLHPALDHLDVHWPFLPVPHRQMCPRVGRKGLPPRCYRVPWGLGATAAPWVLGPRRLQGAYRRGAGHAQHLALATLAQCATKLRVATQLVITGDPAVRHLMPPRVEHLHTLLLAG